MLLDGPSSHAVLTVTTAVQEVKAGPDPLRERKAITIQGNQKFYIYFGNDLTIPSSVTVQNEGLEMSKSAIATFEAAASQRVYVRSVSGSLSLRIAERA